MHHLFKDNVSNQHINSSYEQLSSERFLAVWSLCEVTYRWFHKCEHMNISILWDMSKCQIKAWRLMTTPVNAFVWILYSGKPCQNDTPNNMTQQRWKGWLDCISEYIMYTFDKQGRQDWKLVHSEALLSPVSLWMIFIITIWIIRILWSCWFCASSGRPVWFLFTQTCWNIAQGIWQLGTTSLSLLCSDYSSSDSLCRYTASILCILWLCQQVCLSWNRYCRELHR